MQHSTPQVIQAIDAFAPHNGAWKELDALLVKLFAQPVESDGVKAMLRVFERYPTDDGCGVFWTIVHGLESIPDSERALLESVRKQPSIFSVMMIHRILNAGQREVGGESLISVLSEVESRTNVDERIRSEARKFLERHKV